MCKKNLCETLSLGLVGLQILSYQGRDVGKVVFVEFKPRWAVFDQGVFDHVVIKLSLCFDSKTHPRTKETPKTLSTSATVLELEHSSNRQDLRIKPRLSLSSQNGTFDRLG